MLGDANETVTVWTVGATTAGTPVTVIVSLAERPSEVAVTWVVPFANAVIVALSPFTDTTERIDGSPTDHAIDRLFSVPPLASFVDAIARVCLPTLSEVASTLSVIEATGATGFPETLILARDAFPALVAMTVAVPSTRPITAPVGETVAVMESVVDQ
jgi:hypothetical protein